MAKNKIELDIGERNGRIKVLWKTNITKYGKDYWHCRCDCGSDMIVNNQSFYKFDSCGCTSEERGGRKFGNTEMTVFTKPSVRLKPGFDWEDYIVKYNENIPICDICDAIGLTFFEVRERYDRLSALDVKDIGTLYHPSLVGVKKQATPMMCAEPKRGTLQREMEEDNMTNADAMRLITGIFERAVKDWRMLCNGSNETRDRNFKELEHAFEHELDLYLQASDLKAETIYTKLKKERDDIELKRQRKIKTILNLIDGFMIGFPATNGG